MSEEEIRNYLSSHQSAKLPKREVRKVPPGHQARQPQETKQEAFQDFNATELFCPKCHRPQPVKESVMLYLPDGTLYSYKCTTCHTTLGTRKA